MPRPTAHDDDLDLGSEDGATDTPKCPAYEIHSVCFKKLPSAKTQPRDEDDPITLVMRLKGLLVNKPPYCNARLGVLPDLGGVP